MKNDENTEITDIPDYAIGLGIAGAIASLLWWIVFYGKVVADFGGSLDDFIPCFVSNFGDCGQISAIAKLSGFTPYSPYALWLCVVIFAGGIAVKSSRKKT